VTAIEIKDGKIRLVRWLDDENRPQAKVLTAEEDLADVFGRVAAAKGQGGAGAAAPQPIPAGAPPVTPP
jgi:hypothetical protein